MVEIEYPLLYLRINLSALRYTNLYILMQINQNKFTEILKDYKSTISGRLKLWFDNEADGDRQ